MTTSIKQLVRNHGRRSLALVALVALVAAVTVTITAGKQAQARTAVGPAPSITVASQEAETPPPALRPLGAASASDEPARVAQAPAERRSSGLTGKVNLNTAGPDQLRLLPGVGETKARRIVAWREKHGPFRRIVDLRRVKGIGKKTLERLEPYLTLKGPTTLERG